MSHTKELHREMTLSARLARRVMVYGLPGFEGVTTTDDRKARMRETIKALGLAEVNAFRTKTESVTYAEAFKRVYGEPL